MLQLTPGAAYAVSTLPLPQLSSRGGFRGQAAKPFVRERKPSSAIRICAHHLTDYGDKIIVDFLEYGWPISYISSQLPFSTLHNHPSTRQAQNPTFLQEYIAKELQHRAIIGPFNHNPFNVNCTISLLQCIPKRDSVEPRIVHDLSSPPGRSVNDGIPRDEYLSEPYRLRLPGIDHLVEFINR